MKKYCAEFLGTFILVFVGCGTAVFAGAHVGQLGIAIAFGLALTVSAYTFGGISGSHINPAVSLGMLTAGRLSVKDFVFYVIFQLLGALVAAYALKFMLCGKLAGYDIATMGLGQNGWGMGYGEGYAQCAVILFEAIATFLFVRIILEVTKEPNTHAALAIGFALLVFHLVGIQIDGTSLNPARSFGPAMLVGGKALSQLWLFVTVPLAAGLVAGLAMRFCPCCKCNGDCACKAAPAEVKKKK